MKMLYTPDDPEFSAFETRFRWVESVLLATWGEIEQSDSLPEPLNWLALLPEGTELDIEDVECSLAYVSETGYCATVWDASGVEDDLPWAVLLADDFGVRFLSEYSLFEGEEELPEAALEAVLARAEQELPERLLSGELDRVGEPLALPLWLSEPIYLEEHE
jgi:hypothetical protein